MSAAEKYSINWQYVTHIIPSRYNPDQACVFFTTGKYLLVVESWKTLSEKFIKYKEVQNG